MRAVEMRRCRDFACRACKLKPWHLAGPVAAFQYELLSEAETQSSLPSKSMVLPSVFVPSGPLAVVGWVYPALADGEAFSLRAAFQGLEQASSRSMLMM